MDHHSVISTLADTVPSELAGQLPRRTRITEPGITTSVVATGFLALGLAGIVWIAMHIASKTLHGGAMRFAIPITLAALLAALGIMFLSQFPKQRRLVSEGLPAIGVITKCGRARGGFYVNYEFRTNDGKSANGIGLCDNRRQTGENVWVLYLPQNPNRNGLYPLDYYRVEE